MRLEATAPAKLNLGLAITGRRPDGYHELRSVFLRIGLSDHLALTVPEPPMATDHLAVDGNPTTPTDESNLVLQAVELLRAEHGGDYRPHGLALVMDKHIPMGAGLGGGSSDAAAALALAAEAWGIEISPGARMALALRLGADVPFFASGAEAALVGGVGEEIRPIPAPEGSLGILLITPDVAVSTSDVYAAFDALPERSSTDRTALETVDALAAALQTGLTGADLCSLGWPDRLAESNELWPAVVSVAPVVAPVRTAVQALLGRPAILSGSGSTLYCLYPSAEEAAEAGRALTADPSPFPVPMRLVATDLSGPDPLWRFP